MAFLNVYMRIRSIEQCILRVLISFSSAQNYPSCIGIWHKDNLDFFKFRALLQQPLNVIRYSIVSKGKLSSSQFLKIRSVRSMTINVFNETTFPLLMVGYQRWDDVCSTIFCLQFCDIFPLFQFFLLLKCMLSSSIDLLLLLLCRLFIQ